MHAASCANRPSAVSAVGAVLLVGTFGSTSNTKPWSFVNAPAALASVSSHVSHVPHGVTPPAQLLKVPARLTYSSTLTPCSSSTIVDVPPFAPASYTTFASAAATVDQ